MAQLTNAIRVRNSDVQMGDRVIIRGSEYTVVDEPTYSSASGHQMIQWGVSPVEAGPNTGIFCGVFSVWPNQDATVTNR
jgi:hypothetical protein